MLNDPHTPQSLVQQKSKFALTSLFSAILCANAFGQEVAPAPAASNLIDEIVVTGVKASIKKAVDVKKNAANFVDGINAEDIGQLPDVSVADAIRRVPGITFTTSNGRPDNATIRGLGPDLTLTTLNGRVLSSTNQDSRRVQLGRLPSEILQRVEVSKTPQAKMIEGGVAGTVQMETIKPLSRNKQTLSINARGTYNENAADIDTQDDFGNRGSITYIDRFFDNRLGVAFAAATLKETSPTYENRGVNLKQRSAPIVAATPPATVPTAAQKAQTAANAARADLNADGSRDLILTALSYDVVEQDIDRNSFVTAVQFEATEDLTLSLDATWVKEEFNAFNNRLVMDSFLSPLYGPDSLANTTYKVIGGESFIVASDKARAPIINFRNLNAYTDETSNIGFGGVYQLDNWDLKVDLSSSKSTRDRMNPTVITQLSADPLLPKLPSVAAVQPFIRAVTFDISNSGENIVLGFDQAVQDPSKWQLRNILDLTDTSEDTINSLRIDASNTIDGDFFQSVEFGLRLEDHKAERIQNRDRYLYGNDAANRPTLSGAFLNASVYPVDGSTTLSDAEYTAMVANNFPFKGYYDAFGIASTSVESGCVTSASTRCILTTPAWPIWNTESLISKAKADLSTISLDGNVTVGEGVKGLDREVFTQDLLNSYVIEEESQAIYAQANFGTELWGKSFTGNFGLRVVNTKLTAPGAQFDISKLTQAVNASGPILDPVSLTVTFNPVKASDITQSTVEHSYTVFLPSYNGNLEVMEDLFVRTAVARTLARAPFVNLRNSRSFTNVANDGADELKLETGNPKLDPAIADQLDIALEWYPSSDLSLSGSLFYKQLDNYVQSVLLSSSVGLGTGSVPVYDRTDVNADEKFSYSGLELSYQQSFTFLPAPFDGFGVQANLTLTNSDTVDFANGIVEYPPQPAAVPLPIEVDAVDVSKQAYNFVVYYEKDWGSVRFAWNKQSPYNRNGVTTFGIQDTPDGLIDMTANYNVIDNLKLTLSITNLMDVHEERYQFLKPLSDDAVLPQAYTLNGRSITLGASYKF